MNRAPEKHITGFLKRRVSVTIKERRLRVGFPGIVRNAAQTWQT